jgi:hypothetical protein
MYAGLLPRRAAQGERSTGSLLGDGFAVMREHLPVYLALAVLCGAAGLYQISLAEIERDPGGAFLRLPALRAVLGLGLVGLYFIWPSALRRIDRSFRMNFARVLIATLTVVSLGVVTELGYMAAVVPGVILGVLLSQALIGALLRTGNAAAPQSLFAAFRASIVNSLAMTREHFGSTFGVVSLSLVVLMVPCAIAIAALEVSYIADPRTLLGTAPLLFLTFTYFECVRYVMIVRWYRRLETTLPQAV